MNEAWIPIVMFIMLGMVIGLFFYFRFRSRAELQSTVRVALEKGQELSPELLERLGEPRKLPVQDLRRGIISVAVAFAIMSFGYFVDDEDALRPLLGVSCLPLFVGLAYLLMWKLQLSGDPKEAGRN